METREERAGRRRASEGFALKVRAAVAEHLIEDARVTGVLGRHSVGMQGLGVSHSLGRGCSRRYESASDRRFAKGGGRSQKAYWTRAPPRKGTHGEETADPEKESDGQQRETETDDQKMGTERGDQTTQWEGGGGGGAGGRPGPRTWDHGLDRTDFFNANDRKSRDLSC